MGEGDVLPGKLGKMGGRPPTGKIRSANRESTHLLAL